MFCFNCGYKLMDDAVFCDNCGARVNNNQQSSTNTSTNTSSSLANESKINNEHTYEFSKEEEKDFSNTINMEGIKEKIKKGTDEIKNLGVFNTIFNLIKSPVATGNNIVRDYGYGEMIVLALVLFGINLITTLFSLLSIESSMFGINFSFLIETIFSKFLIGYIILFIVNTVISGLITGMFLKVGNSQDVIRKGLGISISVYSVVTLVNVIATITMPISIVLAVIIYIIGGLVYLNLYFTLFKENSTTSSVAALVLPVIALVLIGGITLFISAEFISRQAIGGVFDMFNRYNIF